MLHHSASVINDLFSNRQGTDVHIKFFFCRFDEAISLKAETILRSIVRQSLDAANAFKDIGCCLERISRDASSDVEELRNLLEKQIAMSQACYIVIDALDECEKSDRDVILDFLQAVIAPNRPSVKILLTSRDSIGGEIKKRFPSVQRVSMSSPDAQSDIVTYTREAIDQRLRNGDLFVGNDKLVKEIQDALIQGAQGMSVLPT